MPEIEATPGECGQSIQQIKVHGRNEIDNNCNEAKAEYLMGYVAKMSALFHKKKKQGAGWSNYQRKLPVVAREEN